MIERTGAKIALLITEGFRDIYEIGRINRPDAYNLFFRKHVPLVERALYFGVSERMTAEGEAYIPLDETSVHVVCDRLEALGIEAVAILLLHCYRDPAHEARVKEIVQQRLPRAFVSASHELSQEYREFERCSTTVANAYIGPRVRDYVAGIDRHLKDAGFNGSFIHAGSVHRRSLRIAPGAGRRACACLNPGLRPVSSAYRRCAASSGSTRQSPSTWAAPPRRPA